MAEVKELAYIAPSSKEDFKVKKGDIVVSYYSINEDWDDWEISPEEFDTEQIENYINDLGTRDRYQLLIGVVTENTDTEFKIFYLLTDVYGRVLYSETLWESYKNNNYWFKYSLAKLGINKEKFIKHIKIAFNSRQRQVSNLSYLLKVFGKRDLQQEQTMKLHNAIKANLSNVKICFDKELSLIGYYVEYTLKGRKFIEWLGKQGEDNIDYTCVARSDSFLNLQGSEEQKELFKAELNDKEDLVTIVLDLLDEEIKKILDKDKDLRCKLENCTYYDLIESLADTDGELSI